MSTEAYRTDETFTGYMRWDGGELYQEWQYYLRKWDAEAMRWDAFKETEWRKVPTQSR